MTLVIEPASLVAGIVVGVLLSFFALVAVAAVQYRKRK